VIIDPREIPTFTLSDSARYLRIPVDTLRRWLLGYKFRTKSGFSFSKPLINIAGNDPNQLSFFNLVEGLILSTFRRQHNVKMHRVRHALDYLEDKYPSPHPLVEYSFVTDGIHIFIEQAKKLEIISQEGQQTIQGLLDGFLSRVVWDEEKFAVRLFPYTSSQEDSDIRVVVIDPLVSFGRPIISGSGIPTSIIAERFEAGEFIRDLSRDYGFEEKEIEEAIRCEFYWKAA